MHLHSLGYRTDLIFPRFDGLILDRGDYLVIQTPANPLFYWGHFLFFAAPPEAGDLDRWQQLFTNEFRALPHVKHFAFGWDAPDGAVGEIQPFLDAGFHCFKDIVLVAETVHPPPHPNTAIGIRALTTDAEWAAALDLHLLCHGSEDPSGDLTFIRTQWARFRAMTQVNRGAWLGAYLGEQLVGALGIFVEGELGRFQEVSTHPAYRRQGICGTLVHHASCYGFTQLGAQRLVIVTEEGYHAARVYQSVGYQQREWQSGLSWWEGIA